MTAPGAVPDRDADAAPAPRNGAARLWGIRADPGEIEARIREEFEAHLDMLVEDESLDPPAAGPDRATARARERFGDVERLARECRAIVLKERTMMKRLHLALTITLAVLLAFTLISAALMARRERQARELARAREVQAVEAVNREREAAETALERAAAAERKALENPPPAPPGDK